MSTPNDSAPAPATHSYVVTQFIRPPQAGTGWSQSASAEMNATEAASWIADRAKEAADLGFTDVPALLETTPSPVFYAADKVTPTGDATASDQPGPAAGDA